MNVVMLKRFCTSEYVHKMKKVKNVQFTCDIMFNLGMKL